MKHWKRMYGQLWRRARLKIVDIVSKKEKDRKKKHSEKRIKTKKILLFIFCGLFNYVLSSSYYSTE
jgi:hypothetical protein